MNTRYDIDLNPIFHEDIEDWAGRKVSESDADAIVEEIERQVEDAIYDICVDVVRDFEFTDEPAEEPAEEPADESEEAQEKRRAAVEEEARLSAEHAAARMEQGAAARALHASGAYQAFDDARMAAMKEHDLAIRTARAVFEASAEQVAVRATFEKVKSTGDALSAFRTANAAWLPKSKW